MFTEDSRLVKVAVLDSPTSERPVILPQEHDDALLMKRRHGVDAFFCGTLLGGCGTRLTVRIGHRTVSHFAHRPDVRCVRRHTGRSSGDHLYLLQELRRWLDACGLNHRLELRRRTDGDWTYLDAFLPDPGLKLRFNCPYTGASLPRAAVEFALSGGYDEVLLGEHTPMPGELLTGRGYALRLRMVGNQHKGVLERRVQIGTELPGRRVTWQDLDTCWVTSAGLMTPAAREAVPPGTPVARYRQKTPYRPEPQRATEHDAPPLHHRPATAPAPATPLQEAAFTVRDYLEHCAAHRETTTWRDLAGITGLDLHRFAPDRCRTLLGMVDAPTRPTQPLLSSLIRRDNGLALPYFRDHARSLGRLVPGGRAGDEWCEDQTRRLFSAHWRAPQGVDRRQREAVRRGTARMKRLFATGHDLLDFAGEDDRNRLTDAIRKARAWEERWREAGQRGDAYRAWKAQDLQRDLGSRLTALDQAVQRGDALLRDLRRHLTTVARRGGTVTVSDLFGPRGGVAQKLPPAGLLRTLVRAEGTVTDDVPILGALITDREGDPPPQARDLLARLGFVRPISDEVLAIVWREEQQRAHAAHGSTPTEMRPRRIPRAAPAART
ncbi:competence protein CoiA family protein [Streptomyces genisteinicus]|uniref:Uncharacterized protein n=1 Tax=Streptomyces genisteinicus TaxID=2768068 RepID=A0A7H0HSV7_9ACTN|nr:competence protein CoiA family protein [Streptomyces genisteinicus]QNP63623.1 hypothetical protein IAG43_12220 [Streptomyces genisteinicus]